MSTVSHVIGLAGIDVPVATFRGMKIEDATRAYEDYYGHPCSNGFVIDDWVLTPIIYMEISEADIENHGVLVARRNLVVNR
jgi:hypothetical protein